METLKPENKETRADRNWLTAEMAIGIYLLLGGIMVIGLLLTYWPHGLNPPTTMSEPTAPTGKPDANDLKNVTKVNAPVRVVRVRAAEEGAGTNTRRGASGDREDTPGADGNAPDEAQLLLLVVLAAALGSYVHATTSFVTFTGNRRFVDSWAWWYVLRPPIGISLALVFYLVIRGGLLLFSDQSHVDMGDLYALTGIAGLVGLCSKQASDKLRELFDVLFRTQPGKGDDARADKLGEHLPVETVMIRPEKITKVTITSQKPENKITIRYLHGLLKGIATRIPVFHQDGTIKYIIHESMLLRFIADETMKPADEKEKREPATVTLDQFLEDAEVRARVTESMAFVSRKATLAQAHQAMMEKKGCRDVFVTESGKPEERVQGWLTNIDIEKYCRME